MENLEKIQSSFIESIRSQSWNPAIAPLIIPGGSLTAEEALRVYQQGYIARLTESLGETFESVWWCLGDEDFFRIAHDYIGQSVSDSYNLSDYGKTFPDYLTTLAVSRELPFLCDLAVFEWKFKELFHSPAPEQPKSTDVSRLDCEGIKIALGRSYFLFQSRYCIYEIWKLRKEEARPRLDWNKAENLLVYRKESDIYVQLLTQTQTAFLNVLEQTQDLKAAIQREDHGIPPEELTHLFQILSSSRILQSIEYGAT